MENLSDFPIPNTASPPQKPFKIMDWGYFRYNILFFLYFLLVQTMETSTDLFLTAQGNFIVLGWFKTFIQFTIALLPLVVVRLTAKWGNLPVVKGAVIFIFLSSLPMIFLSEWLYVYVFLLPVTTRFFNSGLNPKIIKDTPPTLLRKVFAMRDVFLYAGIATGMGMMALLQLWFDDFVLYFRLSIVLVGIIVIFLFFAFRPKDSSPKPSSHSSSTSAASTSSISSTSTMDSSQSATNITGLRNLKHPRNLFIHISIAAFVSWIGIVFSYLASIVYVAGMPMSSILISLGWGYLILAVISVFLVFITPKYDTRTIYLLDLGFDIFPLALLWLGMSRSLLPLQILAIGLFIARDFIKPFSLEYIYSCFDKAELNLVWGYMGAIPSGVAICFSLIIPLLLQIGWEWPIIIGLVVSAGVTVFGAFLLPLANKEKKKDDYAN